MVADPETLIPVPADGVSMGEVFMRGNNVMKGYLKNPSATEKAFRGGWFASGDLGVTHPDGYVDKCTFCDHRLKKGELPACVSVCPTKCMYFGDLDNPESEISQLLNKRLHKVLIPEAGTGPRVYFLH